jgi:succinoglycan biosynthesis protein ExoM
VAGTDALQMATDKDAELSRASISVCVCTYRRPVQLTALIEHLATQQGQPGVSELIVVDNDAAASARAIVEAACPPFELRYDVTPVKNISLARNRSLALARGEWIAFIDDDELPQADWLERMHAAAVRFGADGVLGPVLPMVPDTAPAWVRRSNFFERARHATGTLVPRNELRTGNALIATSWLRRFDGPFDPAYGLTGGGDNDLLNRLANAGARFVWCDEAGVFEAVPPERLRIGWLLRRWYRGGQGWARQAQARGYESFGALGGLAFVARSAGTLVIALALTVLTLPFGRGRWVGWLCQASTQAGKLTALAGHRYEEYR